MKVENRCKHSNMKHHEKYQTCSRLATNEIVRLEEPAQRTGTNCIKSSWFFITQKKQKSAKEKTKIAKWIQSLHLSERSFWVE
jgi:hypothetical protein